MAVALAILIAVRARTREIVVLSGVLVAMFALRVTYPSHVLLLSLPLTGIALVILWRQGRPSAGDGRWTIRVGCSLLVVSFAVHALEFETPPGLPSGVLAAFVVGRPGGGAVINGSHAEAIADADLPTNTWTHLAVSYDGSALRFYVNARPVSTTSKTGNITTSTDPLTIGGDPFYGQVFTGLIDEIRVYDTALDTSQIQGDMTTPVAAMPVTRSLVTAASSPTPVAAFGFDEHPGRAVVDMSGSDNNGTAAHTTWTATGKYGGALSFNGTNSRVTIPTRLLLFEACDDTRSLGQPDHRLELLARRDHEGQRQLLPFRHLHLRLLGLPSENLDQARSRARGVDHDRRRAPEPTKLGPAAPPEDTRKPLGSHD